MTWQGSYQLIWTGDLRPRAHFLHVVIHLAAVSADAASVDAGGDRADGLLLAAGALDAGQTVGVVIISGVHACGDRSRLQKLS